MRVATLNQALHLTGAERSVPFRPRHFWPASPTDRVPPPIAHFMSRFVPGNPFEPNLEEVMDEALRLSGYATRVRRRPEALQQALFPYLDAL